MKHAMLSVLLLTLGTATAVSRQGVFRGRVVAGVEAAEILVSVERQNQQIVAQAFTDSRGQFELRGLSTSDRSNDNYIYLVVEHEGYEPYRERLDATLIRGGGGITIYLTPESTELPPADGTTIDLGQLLANVPAEAVEEYERALDDIEGGDTEDAVERLERALGIAPDYYDAWIDLGGQLNVLERFDGAKRAYEAAAEINPNGPLAWVNLGALYYQEGERHAASENAIEAMGTFAEARASLQQAVTLDPVSAEARFFLGAVLYRLAEFDLSEQQLITAIDLAGTHPQARLMLINVYNRMRRYDAAIEQANAFIDENPNAPERDAIERVVSQLEAARNQQR